MKSALDCGFILKKSRGSLARVTPNRYLLISFAGAWSDGPQRPKEVTAGVGRRVELQRGGAIGGSPEFSVWAIPATRTQKEYTGRRRISCRTHLGPNLEPRESEEGLPRSRTRSASPRSNSREHGDLGLGFATWMQRGVAGWIWEFYRARFTVDGKESRAYRVLTPGRESSTTPTWGWRRLAVGWGPLVREREKERARGRPGAGPVARTGPKRGAGRGGGEAGQREKGSGPRPDPGSCLLFFLFIFFCFKAISKTSLKNHFKISLTYL